MKIDYFNFNFGNSIGRSFKQMFLASLLMLSISWTYGQSTITVETVSSLNPWKIAVANPGTILTWNSTGAVVQSQNGNSVDFDFSSNLGSSPITVTTTGTPAEFNGISVLIANSLIESPPSSGNYLGQRIFSIDLSDLNNLQTLNLENNSLISLNLMNNPNLVSLSLNNNGSITSLDISANPLLRILELENTSLTNSEIDNILITLDANGELNGSLNFAGISTGSITENGIQAYVNLATS